MILDKFEMKQIETSDSCTLELFGELDLSTAQQFRSAIEEIVMKEDKSLVLNLRNLRYIDSTGIGVIIYILKMRNQIQADFMVQDVPPKIKRLFDLTGITKFLDLLQKPN